GVLHAAGSHRPADDAEPGHHGHARQARDVREDGIVEPGKRHATPASGSKERAQMKRRELLKTAGGAMAASLLPVEFAWAQSTTSSTSKAAVSPLMTTLSTYRAEAARHPLPDAVVEKTKHMILDTLAAAISGAELPPGKFAINFAR